jgi:hypothetical protein
VEIILYGEGSVESKMDVIQEGVAYLRGLECPEGVAREFQTRTELAEQVAADMEESMTPEVLRKFAVAEATMKILGVIPRGVSAFDAVTTLQSDGVAGYFDPETGTMYVIEVEDDTGSFGFDERLTFAHEYAHAIQHHFVDLNIYLDEDLSTDAILARRALIEGDATWTSVIWASVYELDELGAYMAEVDSDGGDSTSLEEDSVYLYSSFLFPYAYGTEFVMELFEVADGDYSLFDNALQNPPVSTEQILHPEKWLAGERPIEIRLPEPIDLLGESWSDVATSTFGEFEFNLWINVLAGTDPLELIDIGAEGWNGDAHGWYAGPDESALLAGVIAWDDVVTDHAEFEQAINSGIETTGFSTQLEHSGDYVLWQNDLGYMAFSAGLDAGFTVYVIG